MRRILSISDCSDNGFTVNQYDCITLAIAAILTHYNPQYYDCFLGYSSINSNWDKQDNYNFIKRTNDTLKYVCTNITAVSEAKTEFEFLKSIKDSIDSDTPLLMMPLYNTVFYSFFYLSEDKWMRHGLIISGYDEEKNVVFLRENIHLTEHNNISTNGTPFYTFQLRTDLLYEIYKNSIEQLDDGNKDILFKISQMKTECLYNQEILKKVLCHFSCVDLSINNQLVLFINEFNSKLKAGELKNETTPIFIRRGFINSLAALIRVFKDFVLSLSIEPDMSDAMINEANNFMRARETVVNKLFKLVLSDKPLIDVQFYTQSVVKADTDFQDCVRQALSILSIGEKRIDYAKGCKAFADSERRFPFYYAAEHATNGDWTNDNETNCWFSTGYQPEHWWKVDLGQERLIDKIVLRHFKGIVGNACLVDYTIKASLDDINYFEIVSQKDNTCLITEYSFKPTLCRYLLVDISKPAQDGYLAAILAFEAWGNDGS